jgi:uncharacterized protein (TIGR02996 family)
VDPEAEALLEAIFDNPDDNTPRLVFADWLQEHGQEHYARFIRLQCAAARERLWSAEANRLWEEIGRVWHRLDEEWLPATREWDPGHPFGLLDAIHFDRGFLRQRIPVTPSHLARYGDRFPWLPGPLLQLSDPLEDIFAVAESPALRRVRQVKSLLDANLWDRSELGVMRDALIAFLRSRHLCRVRTLDLTEFSLTDRVVRVLLTAPNLATVEQVDVRTFSRRECDPVEAVLQLRSRFKRVVRH